MVSSEGHSWRNQPGAIPPNLFYLDTLNLGKVILFLMNKVNFSASDSRAGLKNTSVDMCPPLGSPGSKESPIWWKFIQPETSRPRKPVVSFWSFTMQAVLATPHRAPAWSAPYQVQLGVGKRATASFLTWEHGNQLQQGTSQRFHRSSQCC